MCTAVVIKCELEGLFFGEHQLLIDAIMRKNGDEYLIDGVCADDLVKGKLFFEENGDIVFDIKTLSYSLVSHSRKINLNVCEKDQQFVCDGQFVEKPTMSQRERNYSVKGEIFVDTADSCEYIESRIDSVINTFFKKDLIDIVTENLGVCEENLIRSIKKVS
ncbi:MAG: hypothetical protein RSE00_01025 [Clostridia bacterium]